MSLWNAAAEHALGWTAAEVAGRQLPLLTGEGEDAERIDALYRRMLQGEALSDVEARLLPRRGEPVDVSVSTMPVRDRKGALTGTILVAVDVTERKRHEARIRHLAAHDSLTGLPNRRAFAETLSHAVESARLGPQGALLLIDLDNFKVVNDTAGHPVGDRYLAAVSRMLRSAVGPGDFVARLGGDEFGVVAEDVSLGGAQGIGERILVRAGEFRFDENGHVFDLGLSIGVAPMDGAHAASEVMSQADVALYAAKDQGKNRLVLREEPAAEATELFAATELAAMIKDALREDRLLLALQPVVDLASGEVCFHEALVRLRDRSGRILQPASFLPAAERFGLMPQVSRWVIERAFALLERDPGLKVFVNLSGPCLSDDALLGFIEETIRSANLSRGRLGLEVTETAAVRDLEHARRRLRELAALGCPLALDDFGTGFSAFSHLQSLPVDYVKIGDSFVRDLEKSPTNQAIVQAIAGVAHALGKQVIAESIESLSVVGLLLEPGIEYGQGFAFGAPSLQTDPAASDQSLGQLVEVS